MSSPLFKHKQPVRLIHFSFSPRVMHTMRLNICSRLPIHSQAEKEALQQKERARQAALKRKEVEANLSAWSKGEGRDKRRKERIHVLSCSCTHTLLHIHTCILLLMRIHALQRIHVLSCSCSHTYS